MLPKSSKIGDLIMWDNKHTGIIEDEQGIDILVRWVVPIENLPGCSLPCTDSWLTRGSVKVLSKAKEKI